jgi:hypothetical protein
VGESSGSKLRVYPAGFDSFRNSDGRTPCHTFFSPTEEYDPEHLDALAELCRAGFGEVELHLHHDNDTTENLRMTLLKAQELLARAMVCYRATAGPAGSPTD